MGASYPFCWLTVSWSHYLIIRICISGRMILGDRFPMGEEYVYMQEKCYTVIKDLFAQLCIH